MKYIRPILQGSLFLLLIASLPLQAEEIEVFAAASLTNVLKELGAAYEKQSGDKVLFNFAASNTLALEISAGAPSDLFFSADEAKMDDLATTGQIARETRKDLLSNSLVIVVPLDSTVKITSAAQLADPAIHKIALGETRTVPAGIYAKQYLQKIGLWDKISAEVIPVESVRAALAAVETGNVDAGIVYKTDAQISKKVKVAYEVPVAEGPAITYPIALVSASKHAAAAKKFLAFLGSASSLQVFEKYGFITKPPTP
jgi:molybdate transport system substrate-binding protein